MCTRPLLTEYITLQLLEQPPSILTLNPSRRRRRHVSRLPSRLLPPAAMTLLETLTLVSAAADAGTLAPLPKFPTVLNAAVILPTLRPSDGGGGGAGPTITPLTGWDIPPSESSIADLFSQFSKSLTRKLATAKSLTRNEFLVLLNSFLIRTAESFNLTVGAAPTDANYTRVALEKLGFLVGPDLAGPITSCCVLHDVWDILETLICHATIGNLNSTSLISTLIEKNQPWLVCLAVQRIPDLRSTDLLAVLNCFLSPSKDCFAGMVSIRKRWEGEAVVAIEKAKEKGALKTDKAVAKQAAVLLMMGHDGFSSAEICLHYLFGGSNVDDLVLASAVSRLDGVEVLRLVKYLVKWVEKYGRFSEAAPCPEAVSMELRACNVVPSLDVVVGVLGLVLDEHYSYLVLNSKFHDEIRAVKRVVDCLAMEARACAPVDEIVKLLQSEAKRKEVSSQQLQVTVGRWFADLSTYTAPRLTIFTIILLCPKSRRGHGETDHLSYRIQKECSELSPSRGAEKCLLTSKAEHQLTDKSPHFNFKEAQGFWVDSKTKGARVFHLSSRTAAFGVVRVFHLMTDTEKPMKMQHKATNHIYTPMTGIGAHIHTLTQRILPLPIFIFGIMTDSSCITLLPFNERPIPSNEDKDELSNWKVGLELEKSQCWIGKLDPANQHQ